MSKVTLTGYIDVPEEALGAVLNELPSHIALTLAESGCINFEVTRDEKQPNRFNVYEEFINMASFELHQKRAKNSQWGLVSKNVKRHYSIS